jgi:NAD(P)-dependent dehydrogenase (short-subunit alcohol dehydrogenase family)
MTAGSPYCDAKAALSAMVNCLQMEVAHLSIRCLCVEPGHFQTPVLSPAGGNVKVTSTSKFEDYAGVVARGYEQAWTATSQETRKRRSSS